MVKLKALSRSNYQIFFSRLQTIYGIQSKLIKSTLHHHHQRQHQAASSDASARPTSLHELLNLLPSKTSRADIITIITQQLITDYAIATKSQSIFEPHTLTFMAEQSMALVCKGRGIELGTSILPFMSPASASAAATGGAAPRDG